MAIRVPVTQLGVQPNQPQVMPVVQVQPSGVEQLKSGLDKLQAGFNSLSESQFKMDMDAKEAADDTKVMDTYEQASKERARLLDIVHNTQSGQAIGITEWAKEQYQKSLEKLNEKLYNPEQVAKSRRQTVELFNGLESTAAAHEHQQVKVFENQTFEGTMQAAISDGIKYYNPEAPKAWEDALDTARGAPEKFGKNNKWSRATIDAVKLDGTSAIHLGVVKDMIHRKDYGSAQEYIAKHLPEIDGKKMEAMNIYGQINAGKDEQGARNLLNSYPPEMPLEKVLTDLRRRTTLAPGSEGFITADMYNLARQRGAMDYTFDEQVRAKQEAMAGDAYWNRINGVGVPTASGGVVRGWMAHSESDPYFKNLSPHVQNNIRALVSQDKQRQHALEGEQLRFARSQDAQGYDMFKLLPPEEQASADINQWAFRVGTPTGMEHLALLQRIARTAIEKKLIPEKAMVESLVKTTAEGSPNLNPVDNKAAYGQFHARVMGEWHRDVLAGKVPNRNRVAEIIASNLEAGYGDTMNFLKHIPLIGWPIDPAYRFEFDPGQSFNMAHQEDQLSPEWVTNLRTGVAPLPDWLTAPAPIQTPFPQAVAPSQIDPRILFDIRRTLSERPQFSNGVPDRAAVDAYNQALRNGARPDEWLREIESAHSGRTGERP